MKGKDSFKHWCSHTKWNMYELLPNLHSLSNADWKFHCSEFFWVFKGKVYQAQRPLAGGNRIYLSSAGVMAAITEALGFRELVARLMMLSFDDFMELQSFRAFFSHSQSSFQVYCTYGKGTFLPSLWLDTFRTPYDTDLFASLSKQKSKGKNMMFQVGEWCCLRNLAN